MNGNDDAGAGTAGRAADSPGAPLLLAGDIGGTSSRLLLAAEDGTMIAETTGPGANLRSSGPAALDRLRSTVDELLTRGAADAADVAAVVLGISGAGPARAEQVRRTVAESLAGLGIDHSRLLITDDLRTAFLAGEVGEAGVLVLAGTGAVAVRFQGREEVARRDGMGWLLGDIGSAVWLGRRTLEAVAADLDGRGPRTRLTEGLGEMLGLDLREGQDPPSATGDPRQDLIRALDEQLPAGAPAALGRFATLPADAGEDPVARTIMDTAIEHLVGTVRALDPEAALPVVLAGSVLTTAGPIRNGVEQGLREVGRTVRSAPTGLPGALLLARELAGDRLR